MRRLFLIMVCMVAMITASGCIYTHVSMPLSTELNKTELGHKQGEASSYSVLWLFAWGDGGAAKAAENGHISVLSHMDREVQLILFGVYSRVTTIVYGD